MTCLGAVKHHGLGVHIICFTDVFHLVIERHGSGLHGLERSQMVLKGIVFGLFFPFLRSMVLKGGAVMTNWLYMSSIPSVDSAVGAANGVGTSTL